MFAVAFSCGHRGVNKLRGPISIEENTRRWDCGSRGSGGHVVGTTSADGRTTLERAGQLGDTSQETVS